MNENFLNVGITNNNLNINQRNNYATKNSYSLDEFAKKIRMQKYDTNELRYLKNEALKNEQLRNKKKISTLKIQANIRGFLFRKKFKVFM